MNTTWYRRLLRVLAGPIAVVGVIGGAMGMSAVAHAHAGAMGAQPIVVSHLLGDR